MRELGKPVDWAYEIVFAAVVGGLIGARGYYLIQNHASFSVGNVFGGSGLIWYGGGFGGGGGGVVWGWGPGVLLPGLLGIFRGGAGRGYEDRGFLSLALLDMSGPGLALGYAIGRIGCQVSGDGDYGKAWSGPWAMGYSDGTVPTDPGVTVHPSPIYETLFMGLVAWFLWRLRSRARPGVLFAGSLVLGGLERFLVEFVRRNEHVVLGLTAAQLESLAMFVAGAIWLAVIARRDGGLLTPARDGTRAVPRAAAANV